MAVAMGSGTEMGNAWQAAIMRTIHSHASFLVEFMQTL
jgi:hypothetical protein